MKATCHDRDVDSTKNQHFLKRCEESLDTNFPENPMNQLGHAHKMDGAPQFHATALIVTNQQDQKTVLELHRPIFS